MIKAKFWKDDKLHMTVKGHSRSAEKGQDLICAAASMLVYTLAQDVMDHSDEYTEPPVVEVKSGKAEITVSPKEEVFAELLHTYFVIQKGLMVLAANNPNFVKVSPFTC